MKYLNSIKKTQPHLYVVLRKMCRVVKAPYETINSKPDWFRSYEWTLNQDCSIG